MYNQNIHFLLEQRKHVQRTLIDHVWSNENNEIYKKFMLNTYWSDHDTICFLLAI